jgi:AcrR family transcriptional regulator
MVYRPTNQSRTRVGADLKADLVASARRQIENGGPSAGRGKRATRPGPEALSIKRIAEDLKVTGAAPYVHFRGGLPELLAAVADVGFAELVAWMCKEEPAGVADPGEVAIERATRYVQFGVENPGLYRTLFSPVLSEPLGSLNHSAKQAGYQTFLDLAETKAEAFNTIVEPLAALAALGSLRASDASDAGLAVAAMAHGLVGEFIDEGLGKRMSGDEPWSAERERMTRSVLRMLFDGLLQAPAPGRPA